MEDLAYLYLALNEEVERAQRGFEVTPTHSPTAWVAPVLSDRVASSEPSRDRALATVQSPDLDVDCPVYPSFYL